jgi:hypothetical protein
MQKTGVTNLPLHGGKAPSWLFKRMVRLSGAISEAVVLEFGADEFLRRIADPFWFQALSCTIGFDWHSSGTTTTTLGALKENLNKADLGIKIAGGKGKASRKAPLEIAQIGNSFELSDNKIERLIYSSKMSAKVDNSLIQDNYQLYHHCFIVNEKGSWAVVQQGMNDRYARRYHWLSGNVRSFVEEPHDAICCDRRERDVLDMTSKKSDDTRKISVDIVKDNPKHLEKYLKPAVQRTLTNFESLSFGPRHSIIEEKMINTEMLKKAYDTQPRNYEELVSIRGVGPKTIRSLALISDLVYGKKASWKDPVKFSFAHGGKDGFPYMINKTHYDKTVSVLKSALGNAKVGDKDKLGALRRLQHYLKY